MKRLTIIFFLVSLLSFPANYNASANKLSTGLALPTSILKSETSQINSIKLETSANPPKVLCMPSIDPYIMGDCSPGGPSEFFSDMALMNLIFPTPPMPAVPPDFNLTYAKVSYGQVRTNNAPVYGSVEDALKAKKKNAIQYINASFSYISYTDETLINGKRLYMVTPGAWMTASDVSRVTAPRFQGLTFTETPILPFGWVLSYLSQTPNVETKRTPGYENNDYTGHFLKNHDVVWVFHTQKVGDTEWYMVGPDEWVHQNVIARVIPNPSPPTGVNNNRWIEINLFEQTIAVYENYELVFATLIASGSDPFWTRPGLFQIYEKLDSTPMRGAFEADGSDAYYLEDVPWTMYFDERRAIHGAYWRANLGFSQSHGCVNTSIGDAQWIFNWANLGDWVFVWDPSGKTPIDPDIYSAGGA